MECDACGSEWWCEERLIRPAARAAEDSRLMTTPREIRYRLICAQCRKPHDEPATSKPAKGRRPTSR
jgi:hypothetical protein